MTSPVRSPSDVSGPAVVAAHLGDVEREAVVLEPPRVRDVGVALVHVGLRRVGVVVGVPLARVGEPRPPRGRGEGGVVQVRGLAAGLGSGVERRLRRRVVGPGVAVAVRLVGVDQREPGREADRVAVDLAVPVEVEAGAVPHLEVVGVVLRRLGGGVDVAPPLRALLRGGQTLAAPAVEHARVVRPARGLQVGVEQHLVAGRRGRRDHEVVDEPARPGQARVGGVAEPQHALVGAGEVADVERVGDEHRVRVVARRAVGLHGHRIGVGGARSRDAVGVLGLARVRLGVGGGRRRDGPRRGVRGVAVSRRPWTSARSRSRSPTRCRTATSGRASRCCPRAGPRDRG